VIDMKIIIVKKCRDSAPKKSVKVKKWN